MLLDDRGRVDIGAKLDINEPKFLLRPDLIEELLLLGKNSVRSRFIRGIHIVAHLISLTPNGKMLRDGSDCNNRNNRLRRSYPPGARCLPNLLTLVNPIIRPKLPQE